jgi:four helix bundle protein
VKGFFPDAGRNYIRRMSHNLSPVTENTSNDPLAKMRAYSLAREMLDVAWLDAKTLSGDPLTERIAGQLYAAVASIAANLGEGYSRSSGKDRSRIFEYALGSVRESMIWYRAAKPVIGDMAQERLNKLEEIRRMLLAIIPRERAKTIRPKSRPGLAT